MKENQLNQAQKVNKGHGQIERLTLITREMLNAYAVWSGLAQVFRLEREFQHLHRAADAVQVW